MVMLTGDQFYQDSRFFAESLNIIHNDEFIIIQAL